MKDALSNPGYGQMRDFEITDETDTGDKRTVVRQQFIPGQGKTGFLGEKLLGLKETNADALTKLWRAAEQQFGVKLTLKVVEEPADKPLATTTVEIVADRDLTSTEIDGICSALKPQIPKR